MPRAPLRSLCRAGFGHGAPGAAGAGAAGAHGLKSRGKAVTGQRRWIFSAQCNDISGSRYVSFFDETATKMLGGASADSMAPLKAENQAAFEQHFLKNAFKTVTMKCLAKSEVYNEESRLKISCQAFQPLDFRQEGRKLLGEIAQVGISGLSI